MIINLTQHHRTDEQREAGVIDLPFEDKTELFRLLDVPMKDIVGVNDDIVDNYLTTKASAIVRQFILPMVFARAKGLLREYGVEQEVSGIDAFNTLRPEVAAGGLQAMIGGFAPLMERLVKELYRVGVTPVYALTDRVAVEKMQPDGTVFKASTFKHAGFLPALKR